MLKWPGLASLFLGHDRSFYSYPCDALSLSKYKLLCLLYMSHAGFRASQFAGKNILLLHNLWLHALGSRKVLRQELFFLESLEQKSQNPCSAFPTMYLALSLPMNYLTQFSRTGKGELLNSYWILNQVLEIETSGSRNWITYKRSNGSSLGVKWSLPFYRNGESFPSSPQCAFL